MTNRRSVRTKWLKGIPEWEAAKAATRRLSHADAVAEVVALSEQYRRFRQPEAAGMVDLTTVVNTLTAKRIPFVLTGAHGIAAWTGRSRATHDIDILVKSGRNLTRAVKAMRTLYPDLEVRQFFGVTGFFLPGSDQSLLDVTYPHRDDQIATLETAIWVEEHGCRYRVPTLEAALANKYGAMLTLSRSLGKRTQDEADFIFMAAHASGPNGKPIDLGILQELGEKVWSGGGGAEIVRLVKDAQDGKKLNFNLPPVSS